MPIYAYKCASCGHAKDVLQKISDAPLSVCPACGQAAFSKQLTAAGFQLKGSGWYATDFRNGGTAASGAAAAATADAKPAEGSASSAPAPAGGDTATASAPAPAASAAGCGTGCACH